MHETNPKISQSSTNQGIKRLSAMIQERRLTKQFFDTEEFNEILEQVRTCLFDQREDNVWMALSVAGRASSVSKPSEAVFLPLIKERLSKTLPVWSTLEDGEDRYYLAKALQLSANEYIINRAFIELAREETAEKARRIWANIAFEHSSSRQEFLAHLSKCVTKIKLEQGLTIDSLVRRLRRINNVIVEDIAISEKSTGSEFGDALHDFYVGHAIVTGPDDLELREGSANDFAQSLSKIVRLNFQAASDPSAYKILNSLRNWWKPTTPPRSFEDISKKIATIGVETLHIFARQGVKHRHLREAVVRACGRRTVNMLSRKAAGSDASLPESIAHWFVHGSEQTSQRTTGAIETLSDKNLDEHIGHLLISISSPDANHRTLKGLADQVGILMSEEANALSRVADRLSQIVQWSRAVSRSRNIELIAEYGEVVSYDPTVHAANEDCVVGSNVVVATPGAIKKLPDRPPVMVVKVKVRKR